MNHFEFKADVSVDDAGAITGLAWPFGTPDRIGDMIQKGAFRQSQTPLPMLFAHEAADVVGVWESAVESQKGLEVRGRLLIGDVRRADEVRAMVRAGAIRGLSIGFQTKSAAGRKGAGRMISALDLVEISLVSVPMHPGAKITSAKSASSAIALAEAINRAASAFRTKE